ncbi:MAG: endonuclease/exonuclease/phosphatase family protein [Phycisphaerales bacterium]
MLHRLAPLLALPATALAATSALAAPPVIEIDGAMDDWKSVAVAVNDPADAPDGFIDLLGVKVAADARRVHIQFETARLCNLQGLDGRLDLLLDVDGSERSGEPVAGMEGADLSVVFTPPDRRRPDRPGRGVGLDIPGARGRAELNPYDLGLSFAPSHASDRFEVRLERGTMVPGAGMLFAGSRARGVFVFRDLNGTIVDTTEPFTITLPPMTGADIPRTPTGPDLQSQPTSPLARTKAAPGAAGRADGEVAVHNDVRVMSWNAEHGVMLQQAGATTRLMRAATPDIVLLQELPDSTAPESVRRLLDRATGQSWTVRVGVGGGNLRCAVATTLPAKPVALLDPLPMPDNPNRQVRTAALLIDHPQGSILAVSVHLKCCGRMGDRSDTTRITEATTIQRAIIAAVKEHDPAGVIVAGDLNLVGSRTPLELLLRGTDIDGSELLAADARQPGEGRTNATWSDAGQPFVPGRLDYVLVSDDAWKVSGALVLNGEEMTGRAWQASGMLPADTLISDHFPVLVDLDWATAGQ